MIDQSKRFLIPETLGSTATWQTCELLEYSAAFSPIHHSNHICDVAVLSVCLLMLFMAVYCLEAHPRAAVDPLRFALFR